MSAAHEDAARAAAVAAARHAYGRLLSRLAWQWRDIAAAEDALGEAFATALQCWPRDGVPDSPEGWLMTAARRNLMKAARRRRLAEDPTLTVLLPADDDEASPAPPVRDDRLRLLFVCAHPAIEPTIRSALMLQTVLGLEAACIATAFLISGEAMTKRLVRAKAKIKATGIRFEEPHADELSARLDSVLDAIYGCYTLHWGQPAESTARALVEEAVFLAELVVAHLPGDAEAIGLLALLLLCEARRSARLDDQGRFVPLDQQDTALWSADLIERAHALLTTASQRDEVGPFQLEAAIQAAHCNRLHSGSTPWADIVVLYERLIGLHPSVGARIGHAVASAHASGDAERGLRALDEINSASVQRHQPWWAARAHLLSGLPGREEDAVEALSRAQALTEEPALQRHLAARLEVLRGQLH